jgi:uncharacterized protein
MAKAMITLAVVVALAYLGLCALLFFLQRSLIYFPQPSSRNSGTHTITLDAGDAKVFVTVGPHSGSNAVIYFGGNAEDVSYSLPTLVAGFPGHAIYLLHYRGYGESSGRPSEAALFSDALALFDKVSAQHQAFVVVGRSLGSGVALYLASLRPVARLILVTPFDSIEELAVRQFPFFPVRWLLQDKFESWRYAQQLSVPTLIIAAERDEVIPRNSTEALYKRFRPGIASLKVIAGTSHNTISEHPEYIRLMQGALN